MEDVDGGSLRRGWMERDGEGNLRDGWQEGIRISPGGGVLVATTVASFLSRVDGTRVDVATPVDPSSQTSSLTRRCSSSPSSVFHPTFGRGAALNGKEFGFRSPRGFVPFRAL